MLNNNIDSIIQHIEESISKANNNISKLNLDILKLQGFSGEKTRHLYNNLCDIDNIMYLEIGTYLGSTFTSAMFNNDIYGIAVDNWSEFNCSAQSALANINKYIPTNKFSLIEKNFYNLNIDDFNKPVDIYLYDGNHSYECHKDAILHMKQFLSDISIILVDDFRDDGNWVGVINGTLDGLKECNMQILYSKHIKSKQEQNGHKDYWNGCGIFLCKK